METFDVVNENDIVIGKASRDECHQDPKLIHRGTNVYIFNSEKLDYILRVKRTSNVDTEQGKWTILVGEHNQQGESYNEAAKRGIKEELGMRNVSCKEVSHILQRMGYQTEWQTNFIAIYDGSLDDLALDKEEVKKVEFIKFTDLLEDVKANRKDYVSYIDSAIGVITPHLLK